MTDPVEALAEAVRSWLEAAEPLPIESWDTWADRVASSAANVSAALAEYDAAKAVREAKSVYGYGVVKDGWRNMDIWVSRSFAEQDALKWPGSTVVELYLASIAAFDEELHLLREFESVVRSAANLYGVRRAHIIVNEIRQQGAFLDDHRARKALEVKP